MPLPEIRSSIREAIDGIEPAYNVSEPFKYHHGTVSHGQSFEDAVATSSMRLYTVTMQAPPSDSQWSTGGSLDYAVVDLLVRIAYPISNFTSLEELQDTVESDTIDVISAIRRFDYGDQVWNTTVGGLDSSEILSPVQGRDGSETVVFVNNISIGVEYATGRL